MIHFEELIRDPLAALEPLRAFLPDMADEPVPPPAFRDLKMGRVDFEQLYPEVQGSARRAMLGRFFRQGEAGAWHDEMPAEVEAEFWVIHGAQMTMLGYGR